MAITHTWAIPTCEHDIASGGIIAQQQNPTEASGAPW